MELKDRVTVWAGLLTLAVLQVQDRVDTELNIYGSDWVGGVVTICDWLCHSVRCPQMDSRTVFQGKIPATAHAATAIRPASKVG